MLGVKANLDKNALYKMFIEDNKTRKEIAEHFGVSLSAVKTYLRKYNIRREKFSVDKDRLYQLYIVEDKSQTEVANALNICVDTVGKYLRLYGIKKIKTKPFTREELQKLYVEENMTAEKLAKHYGCSVHSMRYHLKNMNVNKGGYYKVKGVGGKVKNMGYIYVYYPDHKNCNGSGYVAEHRLVVEKHIGRYLTNDEIVHHINENKSDNRIENLQVMTTSEHIKLHNKLRKEKLL